MGTLEERECMLVLEGVWVKLPRRWGNPSVGLRQDAQTGKDCGYKEEWGETAEMMGSSLWGLSHLEAEGERRTLPEKQSLERTRD